MCRFGTFRGKFQIYNQQNDDTANSTIGKVELGRRSNKNFLHPNGLTEDNFQALFLIKHQTCPLHWMTIGPKKLHFDQTVITSLISHTASRQNKTNKFLLHFRSIQT